MKYLLLILSTSILLSGELEVDGNLKVTGTIQNDSLAQVILHQQQQISALETLIAQLQAQIALLEAQMAFLGQDLNNADCFGIVGGSAVVDDCGVCDGNGIVQDCGCGIPGEFEIPDGECDCIGNVFDACGDCGGDVQNEDECMATDIDGNTYEIVEIGNQVWMAENLKVTQYRNGNTLNSGIYLDPDYLGTYGNLYTYGMVVSDNELCMEGWHVPSDDEFKQLEIFLGMSPEQADIEETVRGTDEGGKLKEEGLEHWESPNTGATNVSGFTALPAGGFWTGSLKEVGSVAYFWTSTNNASRRITWFESYIGRIIYSDMNYLSIRCIKD